MTTVSRVESFIILSEIDPVGSRLAALRPLDADTGTEYRIIGLNPSTR
jgi:hypothetical protein